MKETRVRFAPSPTGPLHIGGVRTALYNYLIAKKNQGKIILRIEDTDQVRYVKGAEEYIAESLNWCGISFDESPTLGGPYAPYRQSERKEIYKKYVQQLLDDGKAYYAFDTAEELDKMRDELKAKGVATPQYDSFSRSSMCNSLTLSAAEVNKRLANNEQYVVRILIEPNIEITVTDLIRGEVKVNSSRLDDKILFKSDGMPTYHLANIVDDHLMKITHVIRGEEWLPSAPLHILLYQSFGWDAPLFAHLPLLLKPDGNGKLSKRDGDRLGFPVFPLQWKDPDTGEISTGYRESGYLPSAFINMLALLGWNPGNNNEIFSMNDLISSFTIERIGKSGSKFDPEKAKWFNHQYLTNLDDEKLAELLEKELDKNSIKSTKNYNILVCKAIKERITFIKDLWEQSYFFYEQPCSYDEKTVNKFWDTESCKVLSELVEIIINITDFNSNNIDQNIKEYISANNLGVGKIMNTLRLAIVGGSFGPSVADIISILGKKETINRIIKAKDNIKH